MITLFYEKKSGNTVVNNTVTFDPIYGDQSRLSSFKHGVLFNGEVYQGVDAYMKLLEPIWNGKSFIEHIPDYPPLPSRFMENESIWKPFPENLPTPNEINYKGRVRLDQYSYKIYYIECRTEADIQKFYDRGIEEFCLSTDVQTYSNIPNPAYAEALSQRSVAKGIYKNILLADYDEGTKIILLGYAKFPKIPDAKGYRWYLIEDGEKIEIPVEKGKYPGPKYVPVYDLGKYGRWSSTVDSVIMNPKDRQLRMLVKI